MSKRPIIYSALARLWRNMTTAPEPNGDLERNGSGKFSDWDATALKYVKDLGCTHLWLIGLIEHATATSFAGIAGDPREMVKGLAGSPYAIKDYYDIAPAIADKVEERMSEFEAFVERVHAQGLGLMMDFVPNHVARTYRSDVAPSTVLDLGEGDDTSKHFLPSNNFYYFPSEALQLPVEGTYSEYPAKATGNDCFSAYPSHNDWYETIKLNYGVDYLGDRQLHSDPIPDTWHKMYAILDYWASKGVDGFRCDMAEMVPPAFWSWAIKQLRERYTLIFLAEVYQRERYNEYLSAGFDYLYDKVGVYDTLRSIVRGEAVADTFDPVRDAVGDAQSKMCYFVENHDEQRFASPYFAGDSKALVPALAVAVLAGTGAYLHYFAGELGERGMDTEGFSGQDGRTSIFDYWSLSSLRRLGKDLSGKDLLPEEQRLLDYHRSILNLVNTYPELQQGEYYGLNYLQGTDYDRHRVLSFARYSEEGLILVVANFAEEKRLVPLRLEEDLIRHLGIEPNSPLLQRNLRSNEECITCLTQYAPYTLHLEPRDVAILRFCPISTQ